MFVLLAVLMAATLASSYLGGQSTSIGIARNVDNQARARFIAETGLELAVAHVRTNASWRTDHSEGNWVVDDPFAGGTFTIQGTDGADTDGDGVIDDGDGNLADDPSDSLTLTITGKYGGATHTLHAVVTPRGGGAFEANTTSADGTPKSVAFVRTYTSPVVVCTVDYYNNSDPVVARVSNVTSTGFDLWLQNPSGKEVVSDTVSYLVMEEGSWEFDGVKCEAHKYISSVTDENNSWSGEQQEYSHEYTSPVVVGQVMSAVDPDWSVFWARGSSKANPPSATKLWTGKHVGEDPDSTRSDEIVGYIVFETGRYTLAGVECEAGLGPDIVCGVKNHPPYFYDFSTAFGSPPQIGLASSAGMDGGNGGWPYTYGNPFTSTTQLALAMDEDQLKDSDRNHTTEQVAWLVFEEPVVYGALTEDPVSLLTNTGFEECLSDGNHDVDPGWEAWDGRDLVVVDSGSGEVYEGDYAVRFDTSEGLGLLLAQSVSGLTPGAEYQLTAAFNVTKMIRIPLGDTGFHVSVSNNKLDLFPLALHMQGSTTGGWEEVTLTFTAPSDGQVWVRGGFWLALIGQAYLDDLWLGDPEEVGGATVLGIGGYDVSWR